MARWPRSRTPTNAPPRISPSASSSTSTSSSRNAEPSRARTAAMTEIKSNGVERVLTHFPKEMVAALLYGPDQGLVRERAEKLIKTVVPDLKDPFLIADLDDGVLASDPARLFDEAAAISMLGGRRVVRVRGAGNSLAKLFERFLDDPAGDALVVVEGGDLAKSAALPKVFLGADNAAAIACYGDTR